MKKFAGLVAVVAMLLVAALPAAAATPDAGVFSGRAEVGENTSPAGDCDTVGGGLSFVGPDSEASWSIDAPSSVTSVARGTVGSLELCGKLAPTADPLGSCVSSGGYDGQGSATFGTVNVPLSDVRWIVSALGSFVVIGDADGGDDNLVALVQALDDQIVLSCVATTAKAFDVTAVYAIAP